MACEECKEDPCVHGVCACAGYECRKCAKLAQEGVVKDSIKHVDRVIATAAHALQKYVTEGTKAFTSVVQGQQTVKRVGAKRVVQFVEFEDGSGPVLRIEVMCLNKKG